MSRKKSSKKRSVTTGRTKKRTTRSRKVAKKSVAALSPSRKKKVSRKPLGYSSTEGGLLVPIEATIPVPASKLKTGFKKARKEIDSIIEEIVETMTNDYVISEIELSASFSADGKFMGFGVGGAATIKFKIRPE